MMEPLTVVCWLWSGWRPLYSAAQVNVLERMLKWHLHIPHRLVCVTDQPAGIRCETVPLWDWPNVRTAPRAPNCYRRLRLFAPDAAELFGPRMLSVDLDCLITDDITSLITPHDFRIVKGYTAPYNGSMWLLRAGARPQAYTDFDPATSPALARAGSGRPGVEWLGSDQAWLGYKLPGEATWSRVDGVVLFHEMRLRGLQIPDVLPRITFFPGLIKPWHPRMKELFPRVYADYREYL